MKPRSFFILFTFLGMTVLNGQTMSGVELLNKSIAYHDPGGNWNTFTGSFQVVMETPNSSKRVSDIEIDLPKEYFNLTAIQDTISTQYSLRQGKCNITFCGTETFDKMTAEKFKLDCDRGRMFQNYYTYLYGLPMKLKDPGTQIDPKVQKKSFKGKEYLVLKASYDAEVGSDVWFFYFDPTTYAMEVYQFYKGDPKGKGKDTGEYILLTEEATVNGVKMPKIRAWYYNKDDKYLGTDVLN